MAVFMANICKFGCNVLFPNLFDLILHIETIHIDFSPRVIELNEATKPPTIAMSYVSRFMFTMEQKDEGNQFENSVSGKELPQLEYVIPPEAESETWVSTVDYPTDYNRNTKKNKYTSRTLGEKPFACPIPGCKKRYKNINGMKYHSKNGHRSFTNDEDNPQMAELLKELAATRPYRLSKF